MSQFPLYTTLSTNLPKKDLTVLQKNELIKKISSMSTEDHELIYMLIKTYYINNDTGDSLSIPYNAQLGKDKIDFDLLDFPNGLKQLLFKFVTVHKKKLIEDETFQKDK
jgi:hypothetical protein